MIVLLDGVCVVRAMKLLGGLLVLLMSAKQS